MDTTLTLPNSREEIQKKVHEGRARPVLARPGARGTSRPRSSTVRFPRGLCIPGLSCSV